MQQFLALLPGLLGPTGGGQTEQSGNRLQFFLWSLLDLRATVGQMDNGARFYVVRSNAQRAVTSSLPCVLSCRLGGFRESVARFLALLLDLKASMV